MPAYVARRLFFSIFVLWGAVTVIFIVVRFAPGDPAVVMLGPTATAEQLASARERYGLDDSLLVQYGIYLQNVIQLDFGQSFRLGGDAFGHVLDRIPATLRLGAVAMGLILLLSFPLGVFAALRNGGIVDRTISTVSLTGQSLPNFWVGIVLILIFARTFGVLPSAGDATWRHLVLPAITLALPFLSVLIRLVRGGLLEVMNEDYVRTARSKGLSERLVVWVHAVRNALIPVVTVAGLQLGQLLGGAVIVETVFSWPGIGRLLVDAISNRDYTVVQATVFFIASLFVLINLAVDVLYGYLDPRVRVGE